MALGSKKRDYKTEHFRIQKALAKHKKRMDELITQGLERDAASKQAYDEMRD